jgi:hypothetical protein
MLKHERNLDSVEGSYTTVCPILSATVEKKELKFSETSFASFMILLFSQRIIFCSPELHFLEKKGLIVVQKLQVLAQTCSGQDKTT